MQHHCKLEEQYCQRRLDKLFQPLFDSTWHCPATEIGSHREGIGEYTYAISGRSEVSNTDNKVASVSNGLGKLRFYH